jgi:hypothetical protein
MQKLEVMSDDIGEMTDDIGIVTIGMVMIKMVVITADMINAKIDHTTATSELIKNGG